MGLQGAYKTLGAAKIDLTAREMKRKSVLGATEASSELLDVVSTAASDYATDKSDLMAGEKLLSDQGYRVYDATPGSKFNPKNWGGYTVENPNKQNLINPKESLRTLGGLGKSAEFVGKAPSEVVTAWESLNKFEDPNAVPVAKIPVKQENKIKAETGDLQVKKSEDRKKIDWSKFVPNLSFLNPFKGYERTDARIFPHFSEGSQTGTITDNPYPKDKYE